MWRISNVELKQTKCCDSQVTKQTATEHEGRQSRKCLLNRNWRTTETGDRPQITKNLFSDTNLSTRISILKWALESIFAKENEILCDFRSETAKKQSEITKNSDFWPISTIFRPNTPNFSLKVCLNRNLDLFLSLIRSTFILSSHKPILTARIRSKNCKKMLKIAVSDLLRLILGAIVHFFHQNDAWIAI